MKLRLCKNPEYYNKLSKIYDEIYFEEQIEKIGLLTNILGRKSFEKCLDAGCGTGISNILLKRICKCIYNLDFSIKMLEKSKKKGLRNLVLGTIEYIPFKYESFDFILSLSVLHDLKYYKIGVYELYKLLRPGGLSVISFREEFDKKFCVKNFLEKLFEISSIYTCRREIIYVLRRPKSSL